MKKKINKRKKNLWDGRFSEQPSNFMSTLNASINFDKKLYEADIKASIHHAEMLANQNIIKKQEAEKIKTGLLKGVMPFDYVLFNDIVDNTDIPRPYPMRNFIVRTPFSPVKESFLIIPNGWRAKNGIRKSS